MKHLNIDFSNVVGPMKQMNGINCGPLTRSFRDDARPWFKEARIPFSHLHDCENPYGSAVSRHPPHHLVGGKPCQNQRHEGNASEGQEACQYAASPEKHEYSGGKTDNGEYP